MVAMQDLDKLRKERAELDALIAEAEERESRLGPLFVAVTKFHNLKCDSEHASAEHCMWFHEPDEDFKNPRTSHGKWVTKYTDKKAKAEAIVQSPLTDDRFLALVRII